MPNDTKEYAVVIPTLNAGGTIQPLIDALHAQTLPPGEILVVDSASDDDTVRLASERPGVRVIPIRRSDFDHGGTRDMAIGRCDAPFVVLMTQDALPADPGCMAALLAPMADPSVAAVCGRQVARPDATLRETAVRACRYPAESRCWGREDIASMGMRAYLLSDVCAAYRRTAYDAVGGFTHSLMTNEDMLMAADLLNAGYRLAYAADARVWHSHSCTLRQEYRRNRRIGAFLEQYGPRFHGGALGEGLHMVKSVLRALLRERAFGEIIPFALNCAARLLGNRAGRRDRRREVRNGQR